MNKWNVNPDDVNRLIRKINKKNIDVIGKVRFDPGLVDATMQDMIRFEHCTDCTDGTRTVHGRLGGT